MMIANWPDMDGLDAAQVQTLRVLCGWHVAPSFTETIRVRAEGSHVIILPSLYVTEVASVRVEGEEVTGYSWVPAGVLYLPRRVVRGTVEIDLTHGYPEVPAGFKQAVERFTQAFSVMPYSSVNVDGVALSGSSLNSPLNTTGLDSGTAMLLQPYRLGGLP